MSHTPGPWTDDYINDPYAGDYIAISGQASRICNVLTTQNDARLIAAAPDLLAACEFFVGVFDTLRNAGALVQLDAIGGDSDGVIFVLDQARAAIAKASGME